MGLGELENLLLSVRVGCGQSCVDWEVILGKADPTRMWLGSRGCGCGPSLVEGEWALSEPETLFLRFEYWVWAKSCGRGLGFVRP